MQGHTEFVTPLTIGKVEKEQWTRPTTCSNKLSEIHINS